MRRLTCIAFAWLALTGAAAAQLPEANEAGPGPVDPPAAATTAPPAPQPPVAPDAEPPVGEVPLEIVLQDIRKDERGALVDAREVQRSPDGSRIYRVKWRSPDGRVYFYTVDGATGKILSKR